MQYRLQMPKPFLKLDSERELERNAETIQQKEQIQRNVSSPSTMKQPFINSRSDIREDNIIRTTSNPTEELMSFKDTKALDYPTTKGDYRLP